MSFAADGTRFAWKNAKMGKRGGALVAMLNSKCGDLPVGIPSAEERIRILRENESAEDFCISFWVNIIV